MMEGERAVVVFSSQGVSLSHDSTKHGHVHEDCILPGFEPSVAALLSPTPLRETFAAYNNNASTGNDQAHHAHLSGDLMLGASQMLNAAVVAQNGSATVTETEMEVEEEKKREREHKKRSKNWTRPETLKLIRLRTELDPRFAKAGRKTELWDEIAESLQKERFSRDAQQCRDKWEKLTAGYKEVRDGLKDREDNPFYDELYPLLSGKLLKRDCKAAREKEIFHGIDSGGEAAAPQEGGGGAGVLQFKEADVEAAASRAGVVTATRDENDEDDLEGRTPAKKKRRLPKYIAVTDLVAVQNLLETVMARQQRFFRDLLDSMERKEQMREQARQEKDDRWRAEERAQRAIFNNAMLTLTQKLVGDRLGVPSESLVVMPQSGSPDAAAQGGAVPKKRSKNWKRTEVLQLIKLRGEMENRFAKSTRRAALWDELADLLKAQGIKRDGKQCREKWDKLMAEYKDVADGKREQSESHYYAELTAIIPKPPPEAA